MTRKSLAAAGATAASLLLLVGLLFIIVIQRSQELACDTTGGASSTSAQINLSSVPKGPIAGYSGVQLVNAAHIMNAAHELGLSRRDQRIGVMTAMGESSLRVLDHGDDVGPDSRGLFQQRANGAWGSEADRMDPRISSLNFFKALRRIPDRDSLAPTLAASRVQRNADPYHYEKHWLPAGEVQQALLGGGTALTRPVAAVKEGADPYQLGNVTPQLRALVMQLAPMFGIETVGGYRASATDPNGHPAGLAADFMTTDKAVGDSLAAYAQANAGALGVDYILWRQKIWSTSRAAEGWRPMEDRGSPTANHFDHVHINVLRAGGDGGTLSDVSECVTSASAGAGVVYPVPDELKDRDLKNWGKSGGRWANGHTGTDFSVPCGTPVYASTGGTVVVDTSQSWAGRWLVKVSTGARSLTTWYAHMQALDVRNGQSVVAGERLGDVGAEGNATGCHLHFEVHPRGGSIYEDNIDPSAWLAANVGRRGSGSLKVATANIPARSGYGGYRSSIGRIAAHRPDVITLNEAFAWNDAQLSGNGYAVYRPATSNRQLRGNAILYDASNWRVVSGGRIRLNESDRTFYRGRRVNWRWRHAVWAVLQRKSDGMTLPVISAHLPTNPKRPAQWGDNRYTRPQMYGEAMRRITSLAGSLNQAGPVIVSGDMNTHVSQPQEWTAANRMRRAGYGWASHSVDYVFYPQGEVALESQLSRPMVSDHQYVVGAFTFKGTRS